MRRLLTTWAALLTIAAPGAAWGHAEEPNSQNVYALDDGWVLQANVGIVESANPRELICEEAFLGGSGWFLGALGPREWLTFGETVIMRTVDGCQFTPVMEIERVPTDATVHVPSGGAAFVMNGVGESNGLWVSTDRGQTFVLRQSFDPLTEQTTHVRYLDADRIVVSGYSRVNDGAGLAWTVDVATGTATPIALPADVTYPYVLAAAGERIVLLGRRGDQVIFWGPLDDIAENELIADTWPTWATLSDDGLTAWISGLDSGKGVARATLGGDGVAVWENFAASTTAACVEPIGDDMYICGLGRFDNFDVLTASDQDVVTGVLAFSDFVGVRSDCPADSSVGTVCPLVWREIAPYFGIDPAAVPDVGPPMEPDALPDVGTAADSAVSPPRQPMGSEGCCSSTGSARSTHGALLLVVFVGLWRRRALTQKMRRCY